MGHGRAPEKDREGRWERILGTSWESGVLTFEEAREASRYPRTGKLPGRGTTSRDLATLTASLHLRRVGRAYVDTRREGVADLIREAELLGVSVPRLLQTEGVWALLGVLHAYRRATGRDPWEEVSGLDPLPRSAS